MSSTVVNQVGGADAAAAGDVALHADGLGKHYRSSWPRRGATTALSECSFALPAGKVAALIGANGAGKTTLLTILAGLLAPDKGTVTAAGRVAFVSQDKTMYRHLTPLQMLAIAARLNRVWDQAAATRWLERFGVPWDRSCGKLSGGQQAHVAFAIALGSRPDVLLLDEPLANLDPLVRREVMAELLTTVAETGMSVVLSTHVVAELGGVADHLLVLAHGRLLVDGDLDTLLESHVHYAGPPASSPPGPGTVLEARHHEHQSTFLLTLPTDTPAVEVVEPWTSRPVSLEEFVLAHLAASREGGHA